MLQKILVPLDGSELAERALPYAKALAEKFDGELILFRGLETVRIVPLPEFGVVPYEYDELVDQAEEQAHGYLGDLRDEIREEGLSARVAVTRGRSVADAIVDFAEKEAVDLIVKTTHGRSGISRWVFGSVALKVLEQAPCPVFLVRVEEEV
jgi:nucleotide-binding universal stress UspA family protein